MVCRADFGLHERYIKRWRMGLAYSSVARGNCMLASTITARLLERIRYRCKPRWIGLCAAVYNYLRNDESNYQGETINYVTRTRGRHRFLNKMQIVIASFLLLKPLNKNQQTHHRRRRSSLKISTHGGFAETSACMTTILQPHATGRIDA